MSSSDIVKCGYLKKRSQNKGRITAENYKGRFFILSRFSLKYYDGSAEKLGKMKGEIPLLMVKVVEFVEDFMLENEVNAFQVVYEESSEFFTLYIVATSQGERLEWVKAIREECFKHGTQFHEKYHRGVWTKKMGRFNCCHQVDRNAMGCVLSSFEESNPSASSLARNQASNNVTQSTPLYSAYEHQPSDRASQPARPLPSRPVPSPPVNTQKEIYIAVYDYTPMEDGDLELCKGDQYEIVDKSREHWWVAANTRGEKGYIPANYVKKKFGLEIYDWYYKELTRKQAESVLNDTNVEGCFLVRDSARAPGQYSLSISSNIEGGDKLQVRHYQIKKDDDGCFYISEQHKFQSVTEVVNYHKYNPGGLVTRLKEPPRRNSKPSTAGFGHSQFEIDPKDLVIGEMLGSGCFGTVHVGVFKGWKVAVKQMKPNTMGEQEFIEEAKTMTQLSHKNLVQLYGVVTKQRPLCIVTELMTHGALNKYLRRNCVRLEPETALLMDFCIQVCQAMAYLERCKFIHRDLAARNCLVGSKEVVKVADFGLSRYVLDDEYQSSAGTRFPVKWVPPEVLQFTRFSSKSDVWAFGVLMWEIFTCGEMPYGTMRNVDVVDLVVTRNQRLSRPSNMPFIVYNVMVKCWEKDADRRPSFKELQRQLSGLNQEGNYPEI